MEVQQGGKVHDVSIKPHPADGMIQVEAYDTDTDGITGQAMRADQVWRWLWTHRPCRVQVRGRTYWLEQPEMGVERTGSWL
jgi:hypothetical protein